ncbi:hypothetical protein JCM10450v2_003251 [Rhodotorula kratochvilovae]
MLDRLPDELVLLVVEELAPAPLVRKGYHEAQNTLRALCLTARRYRRLAQPVLWRNLVFTDLRRSAKFVDLEGVNTLRDHVQSLVVEPERDYDNDFAPAFDLSEVESILPLLPNLVGLRLDGRHKAWTVDCFDPASLAMNHNQLVAAVPLLSREQSSFWLPYSVEAAAAESMDIWDALRDLGDACARAGRRLLWWEGELAEGELVSHEFWQYAREIKAARATGA